MIYQTFSQQEWDDLDKEYFDQTIRSWCQKHGFMQHIDIGDEIPAKLPYRPCKGGVEVETGFLEMVQRRSELNDKQMQRLRG